MLKAALIVTLWLLACSPVEQPAGLQFVAAIEIPLRTPADRRDLLAMLRRHAAAGGLHVDDLSQGRRDLQRNAPELPAMARGTLHVGVWRGAEDEDLEVSADDAGHPRRAWVTLSRGTQMAAAARVREGLLADIARRWPDARRLPILPSGGLPLADDLRLTPAGYRIARSAASRYGLPTTSPLLAPR